MAEIRGKGSRRKPCPRTPAKKRTEQEIVTKRMEKAERRVKAEAKKGGPTANTPRLSHELAVYARMEARLKVLVAQGVVAPTT